MEPEVHILEKYFQEVLLCFTMTNIQLKGKKEIDLLAGLRKCSYSLTTFEGLDKSC
jgi:hypothetical protein